MKKLLLFLVLTTVKLVAQEGVHYQWHRDAFSNTYSDNLNDTIYHLVKIANVSNYNAFAAIDIKHENWSYLTAPSFSYNTLGTSKLFMKNPNNGLLFQTGTQALITTDRWQTANTYTLPSLTSIEGVSSNGYYGYSTNTGTFTTHFSADGITWNTVHSGTLLPMFSKTQNKLYTIHNNTLKSSTNGGASYTSVNTTYTVAGNILTPNDDTLFIVSNVLHYSFDGGANWNTYSLPTLSYAQAVAKNGKELMIIDAMGSPKNVYYSNNSGLSWTTYTTIPSTYSTEKLKASLTHFILYPNFKSANGATWEDFLPMAPAPKPYDVAVTGNVVLTAMSQGYFGYSLNKGHTFNYLSSTKVSASNDLMAAKAVDANTFLTADRKGNIFISTNQGQTWTQKTTSTVNNVPRKFSVSNDKNTIVLSALGSAYVSFDAGNSFAYLNTSTGSAHFQTIKPVIGKVIDVAPLYSAPSFTHTGFEFYDFNTSNARTLIGTVSVNIAQDIIDVHMANDNVGYLMTRVASTNETIVYKTTNGWLNTSTVSAIPTPSTGIRTYDGRYGNIYTFGTDTVIICGSGNPVNNQTNFYHISTNGGLTWNIVYPDFSIPTNVLGNEIYKMAFFNSNEHITLLSNTISGSGQASAGVYLKTNKNSSTTVGIKEFYQTAYANQLLVFPNPTNNDLFLNLASAKFNNAQATIFNLYGQVVGSVALNSMDESIDVSALSNGVYMIQIYLDGKTYTTKFIKQ